MNNRTLALIAVGVGSVVIIASIVTIQFMQQQATIKYISQAYDRDRCLEYLKKSYESKFNDSANLYMSIYKDCKRSIGIN